MHREIIAIIVLQPITYLGKFIAIFDTGLPSVEFLTIDGEKYLFTVPWNAISPIIITIYIGIKSQLSQKEISYRCCYTTIVVTHLITTLIWQQLGNLLQLIHDKTENLATLALHNFILRLFIGCYDGHSAIHIHNVVVEKCSQSSHLSFVGHSLLLR